ncbi:MAG TPA: gluconokinase [Pyrinomonadaceae bacterium]|nr:gluconokinase [Pyrinomonadaceae bacterium]
MSHVLDEVVEGIEPLPELVSIMADSKSPLLLSLDIGTSGVRAALFNERGVELNGASVRLNRWHAGTTSFDVVDPEDLLAQVSETLDSLFAKLYEALTPIQWVAVSCFWQSLVGVDEAGRATTPVYGWADASAATAVERLRSELDEQKFHQRTGCRFHSSYWPAKLLRLRDDQPEIFKTTKRWLSFSEYLTLRLFGETAASISMASGTGLLNQRTCEWEKDLLGFLNVRPEQLPEIASPTQTFHSFLPAYSVRWPQLSEARWFPAIGDGAANNIGGGCCSKEKVALMIGTSGAMRVLFSGPPPSDLPPELWCYRADRDRVVIGGALSDGGGLYNWIKESMLYGQDAESIEEELSRMPPDSHGLTVLPFWAGERSTGWSTNARGAILGLTSQTQPVDILRAAMEAVAYRFALIWKAIEPFAPHASLVAAGYALRSSSAWVQILADVLGKQIGISESTEASTRGAALLALEVTGKIDRLENISVPIESMFDPNMSRHASYQDGRERQQQMYDRLICQKPT